MFRNFNRIVRVLTSDRSFLSLIKIVEHIVSKFLAIGMVVVTLVSVYDLGLFLITKLFVSSEIFLTTTLIEIFGLFLNVLIALEILENITAYLRNHVVQLELVIVTSLTAVARKIIIFDGSKSTGADLVGLALAIFALSVSYWIVRNVNKKEGA
jgi:uncharacterized membrane protein (DUF373 family)